MYRQDKVVLGAFFAIIMAFHSPSAYGMEYVPTLNRENFVAGFVASVCTVALYSLLTYLWSSGNQEQQEEQMHRLAVLTDDLRISLSTIEHEVTALKKLIKSELESSKKNDNQMLALQASLETLDTDIATLKMSFNDSDLVNAKHINDIWTIINDLDQEVIDLRDLLDNIIRVAQEELEDNSQTTIVINIDTAAKELQG